MAYNDRAMKYDIFISYRRDGGEFVGKVIYDKLTAKGFRCFFDVETMRSGKFNEQLYGVLYNCKDVLVILSPGALDRCVNEGDWVRQEIAHAMKQGKNIVPVMLRSFNWPDSLPEDIAELPNYEGVNASSEYFDASLDKIIALLESKPEQAASPSMRSDNHVHQQAAPNYPTQPTQQYAHAAPQQPTQQYAHAAPQQSTQPYAHAAPQQPPQQYAHAAPQQPTQQYAHAAPQPNGSVYIAPAPKPKSFNKVITVLLSVIIALAVIALVVANLLDDGDSSYGSSYTYSSSAAVSKSYSYEKGSVTDYNYYSDYLGLQYALPTSYEMATDDQIAEIMGDDVDWDTVDAAIEMMAYTDSGANIIVMTEKVHSGIDEEAYYENVVTESSYYDKTLSTSKIAGISFKTGDTIVDGYNQTVYLKKYDNRICMILFTYNEYSELSEMLNGFSAY